MHKIFILTFCIVLPLAANALLDTHPYEPFVTTGWSFRVFENLSVDHIYLFSYQKAEKRFRMMPFQIDERIKATDPFRSDILRHSYFIEDDGLMDKDDEIVWMIRDMGDQAPQSAWIDNEESRMYDRLELKISGSGPESETVYAYAFYSSTIPDTVPHPYDFAYDQEQDIVSSHMYAVGFNSSSGIVDDITIKSPFGTGKEILDTQKIRMSGVIGDGIVIPAFGRGGTTSFNERDFLYIYPFTGDKGYLGILQDPVVRLVREVRQTIKLGGSPWDDFATYITTKFYPFSGKLEGGVKLTRDELKDLLEGSNAIIEFDEVRHSFDFNENAKGMTFMNMHNNDVLIDGDPDDVDYTIADGDTIEVWTLSTGDQGTVFTYLSLDDTTQTKDAYLYYYDEESGGQGDNSTIIGGDTGDGKSYGDQGFRIVNGNSFDLSFTAYFLAANQTFSLGQQLAENQKGNTVFSYTQSDFASSVDASVKQMPESLRLMPVYPNPFNRSAVIQYELAHREHVTVDIYDVRGRMICRLVDKEQSSGLHRLVWSGHDENGRTLGSGIYWVVLSAEQMQLQQKVTLIK